jgi:hypothetical protein
VLAGSSVFLTSESIPNKSYGSGTFVSLTNVSYAARVKTTFKDKSVHLPTPAHAEGSILTSYYEEVSRAVRNFLMI